MSGRTLTPREAARVYDRIGRFQDWQRFYEGPATRDLEAHAGFATAQAVFELGCGTGAYAQRLLDRLLPADATYRGVDVSETMLGLASQRVAPFGDRATVEGVTGDPPLPGETGGFDRFLSVYVFDLLSDELAELLLDEAHRLLAPGGKLCLVALAAGDTPAARMVCSAWNALWRRSPSLVGGCRPTDLTALLDDRWQIEHLGTVTAWAVTSQVVVATRS